MSDGSTHLTSSSSSTPPSATGDSLGGDVSNGPIVPPSTRRAPGSSDLRRRDVLVDVAIALGLAVLSILPVALGAPGVGLRDEAVTLLLLQTVPLVLRRRYPVLVLAIVLAATLGQLALAPAGTPVRSGLGVLVAVFSVAERVDRRRSALLAAGAGAALGIAVLVRIGFPDAIQAFIQTGAVLVAAWFLGDWARTRGLYLGAVEAEARAAAREREERARRALVEERERIARELHDIVTHHVSVIVIQASAGLAAIDAGRPGVRGTLEAIDVTGRQALTDMRRMFGIIGDGDDRAPMPGLDQLGELLEQVRRAGLTVRLSVSGERRPLDPGLELSAYRIIQEALTNTLKHAEGAEAQVSVGYETDTLILGVEDRGGRPAAGIEGDHVGRGLAGMRERAAMFGGTLQAGPTERGFRIRATLPTQQPSASS